MSNESDFEQQYAANQKGKALLDDIFTGKVLFPDKLAQANEFITKHPLPEQFQKQKVQAIAA
ncbi:hypothetical protein [Spirosoma pulveris]